LLTAWGGPGGSSLRRGARAGLRTVFRPRWLSRLVTIALFTTAASLALRGVDTGTDWAPLGDVFRVPELPDRPTVGNLRDLPIVRDLPYVGR
jgi:hypothetical protein